MTSTTPVEEAATQIEEAASARKCWTCGCLHGALATIRGAMPGDPRIQPAVERAQARLEEVRYDCLGCDVCYPALALNALAAGGVPLETSSCPTDAVEARSGWPPLPGSYRVLRYQAAVAICTLTDHDLVEQMASAAPPEVSIIGTCQTENLGIERLVTNIVANPNVRALVVCGRDSRQAIGHLPGQSLVALARHGVDEDGRIVGAKGKRPVLMNMPRTSIEHFARHVELVDLVEEIRPSVVLDAVRSIGGRSLPPAPDLLADRSLAPLPGHLPSRMVSDPNGYFVVYVDIRAGRLSLEHYGNDGVLRAVVEGRAAAELYTVAIEREMVSRLDHAAYLGRELARAERCLEQGAPYVQDGALVAQPQTCGCTASCAEESR